MKAEPRFQAQSKEFWANVRTISQAVGYTVRFEKIVKIPRPVEVRQAYEKLNLSCRHIVQEDGRLIGLGATLFDYFKYRADILNDSVQGLLMDREEAEDAFNALYESLSPKCPLPLNKQKGEKRNHAFLTGMVNMLLEANKGEWLCDYDPRSLTTVTHDRMPLRTLSRRVDGAFPSVVDPVAIWEIKEYYYTTTFGSRVADGVYETLLDGMELEELERTAGHSIQHVLFVDGRYTWWECGRSYLCRLIDMLHMGYVDEIIFGREVLHRLPEVVMEWRAMLEN